MTMTDYNNFQRIGSDHNAGVGRLFEERDPRIILEKGYRFKARICCACRCCEDEKAAQV